MSEYPTGYARTALPFYPELDDGEFEQFCTDLLNLHPVVSCLRDGRVVERRILSASKLGSGSPQRGGDIHADLESGEVWIFQCKLRQSFGPKQVDNAIELAEKGWPHADQYVLVTTCGLILEAQNQIHNRSKWMWWDSSRLTTETQILQPAEHGMNLVLKHFGKQWVKKLFVWGDKPFLTWQEFFAEDISPDRQHFHHRTKFLPRVDAQKRLEAFARNGAGRALILCGVGGLGKSRLLLEFAQQCEKQSRPIQAAFINLGSSGLTEEQTEFLAHKGELLLIVDDAHRLNAALEDVARAASKAKSVRLLVAIRPQALEAVTSQLYRHGYAERLEEPLSLPSWNAEDMHSLAVRVLHPNQGIHAARLTSLADRCPLLVVLGGALLNSGKLPEAVTAGADFRERVFKSFKDDFLQVQAENKRARLERVIKFLSFVSPTPKNEQLLNKAAEILGCSALELAEDLELLKAARLLVENREGIRLYPDLFADAVLLDACLDHAGRPSFLHSEVLSKLPISDFPALMRNIAQADWEARVRKGADNSLFDPIWQTFVRRFQEGKWVEYGSPGFYEWLLEPYTRGDSKVRQPDRAELFGQWASFAVFLPERTLELAEMAIKSAEDSSTQDSSSEARNAARTSVCSALPPLLKPIVVWHPNLADQALNLLWSLDADEPQGSSQNRCTAIAVIAEAASFDVHKPIAVSKKILEWFELKIQESATIERLRDQPWILSALLKPFFGRQVEHSWSTGKTLHISQLPVSAERTRPLRQKALAIADRFLNSQDTLFAHAAVPVIEEAVHSDPGRFGSNPSEIDNEAWRPDHLEAVKIAEKALQIHRDSPVILLQLRRVLWNRCEYDPDPVVRAECSRVLAQMPDTFELRVARVFTSYAHDEISVKSGPNFNADLEEAEKQWAAFRRSVAHEMARRHQIASELCDFVRCQVLQLTATNPSVLAGGLLDDVAKISCEWCATLMEELLSRQETTLDGFLWSVIHRSVTHAPEAYQKAVESLPGLGRPEQLCSLINFIGWKHLHGGGLSQCERECVLQSTKRTEESVVCALATVARVHFGKESQWAIEVLSQLKASGEQSGAEILQALGFLSEKHGSVLEPEKVAQCLANVDGFCFSETMSDRRKLAKVANAFPKQVYEHVRSLHERAETDPSTRHPRQFAEMLSLGPIGDAEYVDCEVRALWERAVSAKPASFSQTFRLALIRSLLWANATTAPERLQHLVAECKNGDELKLVTRIAAAQGSRFVFDFPDTVRSLLHRSEELAVVKEVRELLRDSACGGGRSFTNDELNPEHRYLLEQGDALANRYRDDSVLGPFYRTIAASEFHFIEWNKKAFREEDELD